MTGELEGGANVLVPVVELAFDVADDIAGQERKFSECISLDNAAFVMACLALSLTDVCKHLKAASTGSLKPEPTRLDKAKLFLSRTHSLIAECIGELEETAAAACPDMLQEDPLDQ